MHGELKTCLGMVVKKINMLGGVGVMGGQDCSRASFYCIYNSIIVSVPNCKLL